MGHYADVLLRLGVTTAENNVKGLENSITNTYPDPSSSR